VRIWISSWRSRQGLEAGIIEHKTNTSSFTIERITVFIKGCACHFSMRAPRYEVGQEAI